MNIPYYKQPSLKCPYCERDLITSWGEDGPEVEEGELEKCEECGKEGCEWCMTEDDWGWKIHMECVEEIEDEEEYEDD
jgi:glutaredoxin